jgi:hypothetical protein
MLKNKIWEKDIKVFHLDKDKVKKLKNLYKMLLNQDNGLYYKIVIFLHLGCLNLNVFVKNLMKHITKISDFG